MTTNVLMIIALIMAVIAAVILGRDFLRGLSDK